MGILCDTQIRELIGIEPFEENLKRPGQVSFGVSSYGYDIRVGCAGCANAPPLLDTLEPAAGRQGQVEWASSAIRKSVN